MKFKIKNHLIKGLIEFLLEMELKGKSSRLRTRFMRPLDMQLKAMEEEQMVLVKEHSNLDKEGNPVVLEKDGKSYWDIKDVLAYQRDFNELLNEEFVLDMSEQKELFEVIKELVLECDFAFSGQKAIQYDAWCEAFENAE